MILPTRIRIAMALIAALSISAAQGQIFKGYPDVIICSVGSLPTQAVGTRGGQIVFRVHARLNDGGALYGAISAPNRRIKVSANGTVKAENLADCDGKKTAALREAGQAFNVR